MFAYVYYNKDESKFFDVNGMSDDQIIAYARSMFPNLNSIEVEIGNEIEHIDPVNPETRVIWSR